MANNVGAFVTRTTQGPLSAGPDPGDSFFVQLVAQRGPVNVPVACASFDAFSRIFGGPTPFADGLRHSSGWEVAKLYFELGGRRLVALRVAQASAVVASTTLVDRDVGAEDTLKVDAVGPGTAYNDFDIVIADGSIANTFRISVLDADANVLETFDNLRMRGEDLEAVNASSSYIRLTDMASVTAAPGNRPAVGTFSLGDTIAGTDANAPTAAEIVGTETLGVKTGLKALRSRGLGRGFLCAPDLDTDPTVVAELESQQEAFFRLALFSTDAGASVTAAVTQRGGHDHVLSGFYYPRLQVRDAYTGQIKTIPPAGLIVADWLAAIEAKGPGKAPAGKDFRVRRVYGIETQANGQPLIDAPTAEYLIARGVNPIWNRDRRGPAVWGARTAGSESGWVYLHGSYLWCLIGDRTQTLLDELTYENASDDRFFDDLELGVRDLLVGLHDLSSFAGSIPDMSETPDPEVHAFGILTGEDILSESDKKNGIVRVKIWFREALTAETIEVELAKQT